jgi:nicotinate-nucleotide adenylyltransferase
MGAAIAIFGGTFDPVHNAHLAMARAALDSLLLEKLIFLPTGPTKYRRPALAPAKHRVAMLELALKDEPRWQIDERELAAGASGYTVDTLKAFRAELGVQAKIYFLMGADQLAKLDSWHRPDEVRQLARLAVFARPGYEAKDENVKVIPMAPMPVSASDIRARARRGESLAGLVPPAVANYLERHRLYQ